MSNKCYFESYAPITSLSGEKRKYFEGNGDEVCTVKPFAEIEGELYFHDGDMIFNYCIPDQFLACFDKEDKVECSIDKEKYELANKDEKEEMESSYNFFRLTTTAKKAKSLLNTHLGVVPKENEGYISFGEQIMEFLSSKDDRTIISLFSGEVCFDDCAKTLFSYLP